MKLFRLLGRRRPPRFAVSLVLGNLVVFAILLGTTAYSLLKSHDTYQVRARETSTNLAHTLSLSVGAEIKQIDNALQSVALQLQRFDAQHPASLAEITRVGLEQQKLVPQIDVIRVTDAQGRLINAQSSEPISIADRPYFKATLLVPERLAISEPIQGRVSSKWGIVLARARFDANGAYQGVVYARLSTDRLIDELNDIFIGPHGAVSLRTDTMRLIARYSPGAKDPYAKLGTADVSPQLRVAVASSQAQGSFVSVTMVDGTERVNSFERVQGYSPIVFVGISTNDFFSPWFTEVRSELLLTLVLEIFIVGLSVQVYGQHDRQVRSRQEALRLAEERQALLDNQLVGMVKVKDLHEVWHNRAFGTLFGYEPGELHGASARLLYPDEESFVHIAIATAAMADQGQVRTQTRMVRKDGSVMWIDLSAAKLADGEVLWMVVDVTAVKNSEIQARHRASHDSLTGLLNRAALLERLSAQLGDAEASGRPLAICYIDLDGFKGVNDRYGHEAGDRFLKVAGERLLAAVRSGDLVGRLGGDEFVAVLCELEGEHEVPLILERMQQELRAPLEVRGGFQVPIGASIGVAVFPGHGRDAELLLRRADSAMYVAKRSGKNRFVIHNEEAGPPDDPPQAGQEAALASRML